MDLSKSQWHKYNVTDKQIVGTVKMYFGKYLFKAQVSIPGAFYIRRAHRETMTDFTKLLETIIIDQMWWHSKNNVDRKDNVHDLHAMHQFLRKPDAVGTTFRIERDFISYYATNDVDIKKFLDLVTTLDTASVTKITAPTSKNEIAKLENEVILVPTLTEFKYRVMISTSYKFSLSDKKNIVNYIHNFPDQFSLPPGLNHKLKDTYTSWMSGYFYVTDLSVLSFLQIISPHFIKKIYKLEQMD